ncbi:MAG: hypothetical protein NBV77_04655 [Bacteroidia bacterium]|nr:hypothetical protein [Bacteroidia bacterium]
MKKYSIIFCGFILFFNGCCKEKVNPCKNAQATSADFVIEEVLYTNADHPEKNVIIETDLVYCYNLVRFRSKQEFDEYTWIIGSEVIHDKTFTRKNFPFNSQIEVTLIGKRKPNKECFPHDDGIDTVKKTFRTLPNDFEKNYGHTYHGYNTDNPSDTFTIQIAEWSPSWNEWQILSKNFPKGTPKNTHMFSNFSYGGYYWYTKGNIYDLDTYNLEGLFTFSTDRQSLTIKYTYDQALADYISGKRKDYTPASNVTKIFKGTRK